MDMCAAFFNFLVFSLWSAGLLAVLMAMIVPPLTLFMTHSLRETVRSIYTVVPLFGLAVGSMTLVPIFTGVVMFAIIMSI